MKKIFFILFFLPITFVAFSQMPTDGNYANWNWEDQSQANWISKYSTGWQDVNPPFSPITERVGLTVQIYESGDYTKAKGWHLVWAQFDGDYPYFILYNPHKSIIRVFFYLEQIAFTDVLATLSYNDITNPGVLGFFSEFQSSTDYYYNNTSSSDNALMSVVIRDVGVKNWGAADFPILYDNNILDSKFASKKWVFKFYGCNNYNIHLKGTQTTDPGQLGQHSITASTSAVSSNSFNAQYANYNKQIQSSAKMLQDMQNSVKTIDTTWSILKDYKHIVNGMKNIGGVVTALAGISSAVGAVIGFVNIINGTFDESASTTPVAVTQYLALDGTMDIQQYLGGNTLSIPGVSGSYFPQGLAYQPFNCPMGTISLQKTPNIRATTAYEKYGYYQSNLSYGWQSGQLIEICGLSSYPCLYTTGAHPVITTYTTKYPGKFVKYKFDDDIVLTRQKLNGLQLLDVSVAIVCKANGTNDRKYNIYDKYFAYNAFWDISGHEFYLPLENPVYTALNDGRFIIHKFDEANNEVYFGTPFMTMNSLKGVVIEVPEDTEVKLAILARFSSNNYTLPIIFKASYNLNPVIEPAQMSQVFFSQEQTNFKFTDYYNTPYNLTLNSSNNTQNTACVIKMIPGFIGNNGFVAKALPFKKGTDTGNTIINDINFNCSSTFKDAMISNNINTVTHVSDIVKNNDKPILFPNPTKGVLTIQSNGDVINMITVFDITGKAVMKINNINVSRKNIDLSVLQEGIYLIYLHVGNKSYSERVVISK